MKKVTVIFFSSTTFENSYVVTDLTIWVIFCDKTHDERSNMFQMSKYLQTIEYVGLLNK